MFSQAILGGGRRPGKAPQPPAALAVTLYVTAVARRALREATGEPDLAGR